MKVTSEDWGELIHRLAAVHWKVDKILQRLETPEETARRQTPGRDNCMACGKPLDKLGTPLS
jgi:hypothetical protein